MLAHYVEFSLPGAIVPESDTRRVKSRIPAYIGKIPRNCYALNFYDQTIVEEDGERLSGNRKSPSVNIYFGETYDKKRLLEEGFDEHSGIYRTVFGNGFESAIKCFLGNWQAKKKDDIVLTNHADLINLRDPI